MTSLSLFLGERREEPSSAARDDCPLCTNDGGRLLWRGAFWRLVAVDENGLPGYLRLILNRHCMELTALAKPEREQLFKLLIAIENEMRDTLYPDKINHASLGNHVAHLHWHLIPRWRDDPYFPDSIWAAPRTTTASPQTTERRALAERLFAKMPSLCAKTVY